MSFHLQLKVKKNERSLERVVGLVGRRGYEIEELEARSALDPTLFDVTLTLTGGHHEEILVRQLARLYEVVEVTIEVTPAVPEQVTKAAV